MRRRTGRTRRKGEGGEEKRSKGVRHSSGLRLQQLPELGRALHLGEACAHLGTPQGQGLLATPALPAWEKLVAENSLPFPSLPTLPGPVPLREVSGAAAAATTRWVKTST